MLVRSPRLTHTGNDRIYRHFCVLEFCTNFPVYTNFFNSSVGGFRVLQGSIMIPALYFAINWVLNLQFRSCYGMVYTGMTMWHPQKEFDSLYKNSNSSADSEFETAPYESPGDLYCLAVDVKYMNSKRPLSSQASHHAKKKLNTATRILESHCFNAAWIWVRPLL